MHRRLQRSSRVVDEAIREFRRRQIDAELERQYEEQEPASVQKELATLDRDFLHDGPLGHAVPRSILEETVDGIIISVGGEPRSHTERSAR